MKTSIRSGLNKLLRRLDVALCPRDVPWERDAFVALQEARVQQTPQPFPVKGIVFSKDRALQLHALLVSYGEKVSPSVPLFILYYTSNVRHQQAYDKLIQCVADQPLTFVHQRSEGSFREELLHLLSYLEAEKVFFLVDDVVFIEPVNIEAFAQWDTDRFVPSLRMGENLNWAYTLQQAQPLPSWHSDLCPDPDKRVWKWDQGVLDWRYPLSLDGHLFSSWEMMTMAKWIRFHSPNAFEDGLQGFRPLFLPRFGICYAKSRTVNIPWNRVQTYHENLSGNLDPDFLLDQWEKGLQINLRNLYGVSPTSVHQEFPLDLIERIDNQ